jgi:hypothetical protein
MVDIIAITDHNSIRNVPDLLSAAKDKILALPGVELSTPQGHLLVFFRDLEKLQKYFGSLDIVDSDISTSRCQNSMLDCLKRINSRDGFAILAHVDGERGLEKQIEGYPPHKSDILFEAALHGFEILAAQSEVFYSARDTDTNRAEIGKKRAETLSLGSQQYLARVLFSDAHTLTALGRNANHEKRITRLKMDIPSFDGVALALRDSDARVRLEDEVPSITPYILGVEMEGGFLPGTRVTFNKNLNCIIGGRGAGKTTLFEAVRSISPESSSNKIVDSEAWPTNLNLVWVDEATDYHTIFREILGEVRNIDDIESGPTL